MMVAELVNDFSPSSLAVDSRMISGFFYIHHQFRSINRGMRHNFGWDAKKQKDIKKVKAPNRN